MEILDKVVQYVNENYGHKEKIDPENITGFYKNLRPVERLKLVDNFSEYALKKFPDFEDKQEIFDQTYTLLEDLVTQQQRKAMMPGVVAKILTNSGPDLSNGETKRITEEYVNKHFSRYRK